MASKARWASTPAERDASQMSLKQTASTARTSKKSSVCAKILPWFMVPNIISPRGLSMRSGRIEPKCQKGRVNPSERASGQQCQT